MDNVLLIEIIEIIKTYRYNDFNLSDTNENKTSLIILTLQFPLRKLN